MDSICGNELKVQIAEIYLPTIGALTYTEVHQISIITYPSTLPAIYISTLRCSHRLRHLHTSVLHQDLARKHA